MADKKRQPSSTPSDGPGDQPKVKRMRKGTKSCTECRRRKIKCIFDPLRPEVCNDCFTRGATCIDQEHADFQPKPSDQSQQGLKGRVSQLEDLVRTLVSKLDSSSEAAASKLTSPKPPTPATESGMYLAVSILLADQSHDDGCAAPMPFQTRPLGLCECDIQLF